MTVINECQTRLDTENFQLWREAGLLLDNNGQVTPSNTAESHFPELHVMKEDMISNALVWLSSRLCNFVAAGEGFNPVLAGDRSEAPQEDDLGDFGKSQKSLLEKWHALWHTFDVWLEGLPSTFKPSARIKSKIQRPLPDVQLSPTNEHHDHPFDEVWYSIPMCAATIQHYHMARILLLINKPHESTARRSTITNRLRSYRKIEEEIVYHCYEIWYVACTQSLPLVLMIYQQHCLFPSGRFSAGS